MQTRSETPSKPVRWLDLIRASGEADLGKAMVRLATLAAASGKAEVGRLKSETSSFILQPSDFPHKGDGR